MKAWRIIFDNEDCWIPLAYVSSEALAKTYIARIRAHLDPDYESLVSAKEVEILDAVPDDLKEALFEIEDHNEEAVLIFDDHDLQKIAEDLAEIHADDPRVKALTLEQLKDIEPYVLRKIQFVSEMVTSWFLGFSDDALEVEIPSVLYQSPDKPEVIPVAPGQMALEE